MAHILSLYRRTHLLASGIAAGRITSSLNSVVQREAVGATRVRGQSLGLIGLGRIGTAVALRARAFGFDVGFFDPQLPDGADKAVGLRRFETLEALLAAADCVSLHCTYNPTSHHILGAAALRQLHARALVVNTARGGLVDDAALAAALAAGRLGGAALDCQEAEPDLRRSPLAELQRADARANLILTPHAAFYSDQSVVQMRQMASAEARRALQLPPPPLPPLGGGGAAREQWLARVTATLRNCVNAERLAAHTDAACERWRAASRSMAQQPYCPLRAV